MKLSPSTNRRTLCVYEIMEILKTREAHDKFNSAELLNERRREMVVFQEHMVTVFSRSIVINNTRRNILAAILLHLIYKHGECDLTQIGSRVSFHRRNPCFGSSFGGHHLGCEDSGQKLMVN